MNELKRFLEHGSLPADPAKAKKMALQQTLFGVIDGVVYYIDPKRNNRKRAVAPKTLQLSLLQETHSGPYSAHFSGQRMFRGGSRIDGRGVLRVFKTNARAKFYVPHPLLALFPHACACTTMSCR